MDAVAANAGKRGTVAVEASPMFMYIAGITAVAAVICYALAYTVLKRPRKGFAKAMGAIFATMAVLMAFFALVGAG